MGRGGRRDWVLSDILHGCACTRHSVVTHAAASGSAPAPFPTTVPDAVQGLYGTSPDEIQCFRVGVRHDAWDK